jgi:large subunit ribosomal protein L4
VKVKVYNQKGEEIETMALPKEIFEVEINPDLIHQVFLSQQANKRRIIADTKDRSEVRGGGKKPWRQKGTGRARHGSIRSPIWIGGGVTFGPTTDKVFKKRIPKKMRRKALFMVLSSKARDNELIILDNLKTEKPKTKMMADVFKRLSLDKEKKLIALPSSDINLYKSLRNLDLTKVIIAKDLNVIDLLSFKYLVMPKDSIKKIEETFLTKEK